MATFVKSIYIMMARPPENSIKMCSLVKSLYTSAQRICDIDENFSDAWENSNFAGKMKIIKVE